MNSELDCILPERHVAAVDDDVTQRIAGIGQRQGPVGWSLQRSRIVTVTRRINITSCDADAAAAAVGLGGSGQRVQADQFGQQFVLRRIGSEFGQRLAHLQLRVAETQGEFDAAGVRRIAHGRPVADRAAIRFRFVAVRFGRLVQSVINRFESIQVKQ